MADWYRGEAVGVAQSPGKTNPHDFADGLYFANTSEAAEGFAELRTTDLQTRRLYKVDINVGSMRVLDLTKDPRWKDMLTKFPVLEDHMKNANENYGRTFNTFLKSNNIDLSQYDAVIGPLYIAGTKGKLPTGHLQLCILHKNGQMSKIAIDLRGKMQPLVVTGVRPVTPKTPIGHLRFSGKIGAGLKIAGGAAATFIVSWLLSKKIEQLQQESTEKQLREAQPAIEKDIRANKEDALRLLAAGKPAFAVIRISITHQQMNMGPGAGWSPTWPGLKYAGLLGMRDSPVKPEDSADGEEHDYFNAPGSMLFVNYYKLSLPLSFSEEEVRLFKAYAAEFAWYDEQLAKVTAPQDVQRLLDDRDALVKQWKAALAD